MRLRAVTAESSGHSRRRSDEMGRHRRLINANRDVSDSTLRADGRSVPEEMDLDEEPKPPPPDGVSVEVADERDDATPSTREPSVGRRWTRVVSLCLLPTLMVALGGSAGYLTWETISAQLTEQARKDSVGAARDGTVALLTYGPDTVDKDLSAARDRLTGSFQNSYTLYTRDVVIPDASHRHVSSVVSVPAAASVWATTTRALVVVYVNQTFLHDPDPPTSTASVVRITLDKVGRQWLISDFNPV